MKEGKPLVKIHNLDDQGMIEHSLLRESPLGFPACVSGNGGELMLDTA